MKPTRLVAVTVLTVSALAFAGLRVAAGGGQVRRKPSASDTPAGRVFTKAGTTNRLLQQEAAPQPAYKPALHVEPRKGLQPDELAFQLRIAKAMNEAKLDVPMQRSLHFQWLKDHPIYTVVGWYAVIEAVEPIAGGYRVGVMVVPSITSGKAAFTSDHVFETYSIIDGQVRYVEGAPGNVVTPDIIGCSFEASSRSAS